MNALQVEQKAIAMAAIKAEFAANPGTRFRCIQLAGMFEMSPQRMNHYLRHFMSEGFIQCEGREPFSYFKPVELDLSCLAGTPFRAFMGYQALMGAKAAA